MSQKRSVRSVIRKTPFWLVRLAILNTCGILSIFLLASAYESLYNRSLPFVHTLDRSSLQALDKTYDLQKAYTLSQDPKDESVFGTFGTPQNLKLPGRTKKLDIVPAIHPKKDEWLARANTLHLLTPEGERKGNLGIALLYGRTSFRTLDETNLPAEGGNLFIDTDNNWRYVYKVISVTIIADKQSYVPADNGSTAKLLIICNDEQRHTNIIVEANLLTVQGIEL